MATVGWIYAHSSTPIASVSSAPGENSCAQCHAGTVNSGTGDATLVLGAGATTYTPGNLYVVTVTVTDGTMSRFGFQCTALTGGTGASVGTFAVTNTTNTATQLGTVSGFSRRYISHKSANATNTWQFNWTAPPTNIGTITFYLVGNATNNNNNTSGDKVYTRTFAFAATPPPTPVAAFAPNSTSICPGTAVTFTDQSTNSPATWNWSFPGGTPATSTAQNPTVTYASPGTFNVTLIATNVTGADTIAQPNLITVNAVPQLSGTATNASCFGSSTGSIDLSVAATANNTYQWSDNSTAEDPSGLAAGAYSVTVTSIAGCVSTASFTVGEPTAVAVSTTATLATCGMSNGSASASASGGTPGYTFVWSTGAITPSVTGLAAGTYTVTATDQNGCTSIATAAVSNSGAPTGLASSTDITCFGDADGTASINVTGGTPPYTYAWSNSGTTASISNLTPGTYNVTVLDASQCQLVASVTLQQPIALTVMTASTPDMGGNQGTATATPAGGNGGYTYLAAGSYTVIVTDSLGCSTTATVTVNFVVGVKSKLSTELFEVGPNPFADVLILRPTVPMRGQFVVHLVDIQGHIVYAKQLEANGLAPIPMPTVTVPDGIYLLMIMSDQGKLLKKIVKTTR
jgi:PKD repeat protein